MGYELFPPTLREENTLPASINMDFTGEEDQETLATTKEYCYWWAQEEEEGIEPRVPIDLIWYHFQDYIKTVSVQPIPSFL